MYLLHRVVNLPSAHMGRPAGNVMPGPAGPTERVQLCQELEKLNVQIESLQFSEDERLARELQAIELNIQETERKIQHVSHCLTPY